MPFIKPHRPGGGDENRSPWRVALWALIALGIAIAFILSLPSPVPGQ